MITKVLKNGLSFAFMLAFLAGCATTDTEDEGADAGMDSAETDGVTTGTAGRDELSSREEDDQYADLDTIVYFGFDQATLKPESRSLLLAHAERLKDSDEDVRLEGHADERGSREYNMALGERRANAVRDFLVLQGVSRDSIEVVSYGEERPLAMGSSENAWERNRRVEIMY